MTKMGIVVVNTAAASAGSGSGGDRVIITATTKLSWRKIFLLGCCLFAISTTTTTTTTTYAWKQCSEEAGGGKCPDMATCCPTGTPGISSCITSKAEDPDGQGVCCNDDIDNDNQSLGNHQTGCGYGYTCAIRDDGNHGEPYCKLNENHPGYITYDVPRYQLCTVPDDMQEFYGFEIETPALYAKRRREREGEEDPTYQLAYYSNMGSITTPSTDHLLVEDVLIMIHGSSRNADDYFCAALSIIPSINPKSTLVITPKFFAPEDEQPDNLENVLVWEEKTDKEHALSHSWRYGADALNAPISSYETLDLLLEYLVSATVQYPNLQRISVAGHSAGGQVTHRWALLSNSHAWDISSSSSSLDIRAIVANPRSFCYLDARRIIHNDTFVIPDDDDIALCPEYNQWQWGLQPGGDVICPYKDRAIADEPQLAGRYATRQVIYLSGEYDNDAKPDFCATSVFQGGSRLERSQNYFQALEYYFGKQVHERNVVPKSPHDHFLMFQSEEGRKAIFGSTAAGEEPNNIVVQDGFKRSSVNKSAFS